MFDLERRSVLVLKGLENIYFHLALFRKFI